MLTGKTVVLAITGSIAAYKIANLARMLKKLHADVQVLMTQNAINFINPITLETLTNQKCLIDTFDRNFQYSVEHVALAKRADVVLVAPASANVIGKLANGIADDMLTTTILACPCKKWISPAMNHNMYHNPIVQDNIQKLERFGYGIIPPATGMLANGDTGDGRMPEETVLLVSLARDCLSERPCRKEVPDFCWSNAGSTRPCTVLDESFFWKDGLCIGTGSDAARSRSDIGCSSYGSCTAAICKSCSGDIRSRHGRSDFTGCSGI